MIRVIPPKFHMKQSRTGMSTLQIDEKAIE